MIRVIFGNLFPGAPRPEVLLINGLSLIVTDLAELPAT